MCAAMGLITLGLAAFVQMPRQEDPSIKINRVRIIIPYPGADPTKTEKLVTKVLEEEIAKLDTVEDIVSISKNNIASIEVFFYYETDIGLAIEELKDTVRDTTTQLPKEALAPIIFDEIEKSFPVIAVATGKNYTLPQLEAWMEAFEDECADLPGAINAEIRGEWEKTIFVSLYLEKLSKYRIPVARIISALSARNDLAPGGIVKLSGKDFLIQTQGEFSSIAEIENVIVDISEQGNPIYIKDLAVVETGRKDLNYKVRYNGQEAIALAISMRETYNVLRFEEEVQEKLSSFQKKLPPGIDLRLCINQAQHVSFKLDELYSNLFQGIVCVIFVLFFFIGIRESTVISLSIPITIVTAIFFLNLLGVRLEQISIASFVVALGLLVDNSIVIIENIHDHLKKSDQGIIETFALAVQEVAPSITSGTLTTIAAFIPMLFMGGDIGAYIRSIPIVMIVTLTCSLSLALSVTPIMYFWVYPKRSLGEIAKKEESSRLRTKYRSFIRFCLKRRYACLFIGFLFVVLSLVVAKRMDRQLFPTINRPQYIINAYLPEGGNLDQCEEVGKSIEKIMLDSKRFPEVKDIACFLGNGSPKFYFNELGDKQLNNPAYLEAIVNLHRSLENKEVRTTHNLVQITQEILDREISGARIRVREFKSGKAFRAPVIIRLTGNNLDILKSLTEKLKKIVESIPGTRNIHDNLGESTFKIQVKTDAYALNQVGLTHADIAKDIRTSFSGEIATTFLSGDEETDVMVRLLESDRQDFENIEELYFASRLSSEKISFNQVAKLQLQLEKAQINRYNQRWSASVFSDAQGRLPDAIQREIKAKIANWELPPGFTMTFEGENKEVTKSFGSLRVAAFFSILLIYLILATEFNSLFQPLIILLILPLSVAGAIFGLKLTGNPLGFMSMMGFVSLIGIVVNDAIILVDFANARIQKNKTGSMVESMENYSSILVDAAEKRLKPIIATSVTTVLSLLPLALYGGSLWSPFAWAVITGLIVSTVLTLVYVPCFFRVLEDIRVYFKIIPTVDIHVYTNDSRVKKELYHILSASYKLDFFDPKTKDLTHREKTDLVIIDETGLDLLIFLRLLQQTRHAPHIATFVVSKEYPDAQSFLEKRKLEQEISSYQEHLIKSSIYVTHDNLESLPKELKGAMNKIGEVLWNIWNLSRMEKKQ